MSILPIDTIESLREENDKMRETNRALSDALFSSGRRNTEAPNEEEVRNRLNQIDPVYTNLFNEDLVDQITVHLYMNLDNVIREKGFMSDTYNNVQPVMAYLEMAFPYLTHYYGKIDIEGLKAADMLPSKAKEILKHYDEATMTNLERTW